MHLDFLTWLTETQFWLSSPSLPSTTFWLGCGYTILSSLYMSLKMKTLSSVLAITMSSNRFCSITCTTHWIYGKFLFSGPGEVSSVSLAIS